MTSSDIDINWIDALAKSVVEQVQAFVPADVRLSIEESGSSLLIRASAIGAQIPEERSFFGVLACGVEDRVEGARIAIVAFLSGLQDWIALNTAMSWPGQETVMPMLRLRTDESRVDVWFGSEDSPERVSAVIR